VLTIALVLTAMAGLLDMIWHWRQTADALEEVRKRNYGNLIVIAERYLAASLPHRAEQNLESCPSDLRGWEWHYLKGWWQHRTWRLEGHAARVVSVAFSADGRRLASADRDGRILVWWFQGAEDRATPGAASDFIVLGSHPGEVEISSLAFDARGDI